MAHNAPHTEETHEDGRYITSRGIEIKIRRSARNGMYYIHTTTGPLQKTLKGSYTNFKNAEHQVIRYLKKLDTVLFKCTYPGSPPDLYRPIYNTEA